MTSAQDRAIIIAAVIGLVGVISAAVISNMDGLFGSNADPMPTPTPLPVATGQPELSATESQVGPRAPEIEINQRYRLWGEDTLQISLEPGELREIGGMELYADHHTQAPQSSCAGPGFVPYTWQVRQPWPRGGELEVRSIIKQGGGATEIVGTGSTGSSSMGFCGIHQLKNVDVIPIKVEVRYVSAVDTLNN
ncbi:hypothetical protein [Erythrobacter sp. THAF29]|uniref:hypothetical protein n=1 Tax=Erythrobacter sp. THAF29 TaxID=2587851 RepID=UPI001267E4A8|nr:hypothetical protein [Erythrobacter sp. THAF29]QFT76750.1 hypothetical protein FIU90_04245 [Erythrobacter sp. THAF29]